MSPPTPAPRRVRPTGPSSTAIFLVLRKMRAPLIVLISLFSVSVVGLTLIPGVDADGRPWRMDLFEAFYFMSYTATTIGFGEIPYPFTTAQRTWVVITIYLSVVAWAYAIGSVLALLQERGFREALALQRFERRVRRMGEPFQILAGFGQAGEQVARTLDAQDRRLVVLDIDPGRIEALELASLHSDAPGLVADASNPGELLRAGLEKQNCRGVLALTNDDAANLAIVEAVDLLRRGLPVVSRTTDDRVAERMTRHDCAKVVDPFNLFGDELMLAVRAPQTYRLVNWLGSEPGNALQDAMEPPQDGRWVVCGYGRFGRHLVADLLRNGLAVTVLDARVPHVDGADLVRGDPVDPGMLEQARLEDAVALVAATDTDIDNLDILAEARRINDGLFLAGRQNDAANAPLFGALGLDATLVPTDLVAREALARISDPTLWRFLHRIRAHDDQWSDDLIDRIRARCGTTLPDVWVVELTSAASPALQPHWPRPVTVGDLLRSPEDRSRSLDAVVLMIEGGGRTVLAPADDEPLEPDDRLLLVGMGYDRRALSTTLTLPTAAHYVLTGDRVGQSWLWRTLVDR